MIVIATVATATDAPHTSPRTDLWRLALVHSVAPGENVPVAEEIYRLMGRGRRLLWMALAAELERQGQSIFVWQTVCYLARNGPTSQRDLAYANAQHPAGMSRLLHELEAAGFVRRRTDE